MVATDPTLGAEEIPDELPGDADEGTLEDRSGVDEAPAVDAAHPSGGCPVTWCPICVTVGAVQPLRPDVVEHMLKAGTELFLAFRAIVDARADEAAGGPASPSAPSTLEKIDLG